jgi:hypothetical protein
MRDLVAASTGDAVARSPLMRMTSFMRDDGRRPRFGVRYDRRRAE